MKQRTIVISAVNITRGGALTILNNCLEELSKVAKYSDWRIIALVNNKQIANYPNIKYKEFPKAKKNWFYRVFYEYWKFRILSRTINPNIWLSLHDMTPNVKADKRFVYCHNPTSFYSISCRDFRFSYKIVLFSIFYKYLYSINIKKNNLVIVQQNWLKDEFCRLYNLDKNRVLVAYANSDSFMNLENNLQKVSSRKESDIYRFFYPSLPQQFKNFEVVCAAVEILNKKSIGHFEVILTIDERFNRYSKYIYNRFKHLKNINFCGILSKDKMLEMYQNVDCLIFASKLETWGLPISEFKQFEKPMLLSDLPYAHETSFGAKLVSYFNPNDAKMLAHSMELLINGDNTFLQPNNICNKNDLFSNSWNELFNIILNR